MLATSQASSQRGSGKVVQVSLPRYLETKLHGAPNEAQEFGGVEKNLNDSAIFIHRLKKPFNPREVLKGLFLALLMLDLQDFGLNMAEIRELKVLQFLPGQAGAERG